MKKGFAFFLIANALASETSMACTAFTLINSGKVIVAKSYDWFRGFEHGAVFTNRVGLQKYAASLTEGGHRARWTSKHGSVVLTQFGKGFPVSGMNTEGLVVEMLQLKKTRYEKHAKDRPFINESQWSQYQLDNYKSVDEVVAHLHDLHVDGLYTGIHYFVADRSGKTAIVEFVKGQTHVYVDETLPLAVLSNHPYPDLLAYAEKNGHRPVQQSRVFSTSKQRFTLAASGVAAACSTENLETLAWKTLDHVKMAGLAGVFEPSQWNIVHDPQALVIRFRTRTNPDIRTIDFSNLDLSLNGPDLIMGMEESTWQAFSPELNLQLIEKNFPLISKDKRRRLGSHSESPCGTLL